MKRFRGLTRRGVLKGAAAGAAATLAAPAFLRETMAQATGPIKIGIPCALTGTFAAVGQVTKRGAEFFAKERNAKGGILGRPIELLIEDTQGNPANCVRKAQEMVERHNCRLITGVTVSSEALALVPKLEEWNTIFMSSINGDGRLTAASFVPNFFRANTSGPMGARAISLFLRESKMQKFFALGMDYAWGHNSVQVFETELKNASKEFIGKVFSPSGTKDFSTYITKIRQSGADGVYLVLAADDNNAFLSQAHQYRLAERMTMLAEQLELVSVKAVGEAAIGLTASSRYPFTLENPANAAFVAAFQKEHGEVPDQFDGEAYHGLAVLAQGIEKAKSIEAEPLRKAMEGMVHDGIKGKVTMRACDHQGEQRGYVVQVAKTDKLPHPTLNILKTYGADQITPPCNKMTYDN
ncbi:MAG: branched-chain amino acid ABC transporter substrate-binding protein [Alphaproteobacteria bacterium]|nr:branched-chain amino acid ABC transporter substrate-binding protein [Alphaproteobacteria bacterium]